MQLDTGDAQKFALSKAASATIFLDSEREMHVVQVQIDLASQRLQVTGEDSAILRNAVEKAIQDSMVLPITGDDLTNLEASAAPALAVAKAIYDLKGTTGWSTSPHALAAVVRAVTSLDLEGYEASVSNFGF